HASVLEGVLDLLARVLHIGLGLVGLALGFEPIVVGALSGGVLGFARGVLGSVLGLVNASHDVLLLSSSRHGACRGCAGGAYRARGWPSLSVLRETPRASG